MNRKEVSGIMLTLLLASILTSTFIIQQARTDPAATIIVPDDYAKIQWAVGNASDGDTVYVRAGTYYEQVNIDKSISLAGEDRETTIIDCYREDRAVTITADNVVLSGFTIQNASESGDNLELSGNFATIRDNKLLMVVRLAMVNAIRVHDSIGNNITDNIIENTTMWNWHFTGIYLHNTNETTITRNRISGCASGAIYIHSSYNNTISQNNLFSNRIPLGIGIMMASSSDNNIFRNNASNNGDGIYLDYSCYNNIVSGNNCSSNYRAGIYLFNSAQNNTICGNTLSSNEYGIILGATWNNIIRGNTISLNDYGIHLYYSTTNDNQIFHNSFIDNTEQADIEDPCTNVWDDGYPSGGNYWSDYTGVDSDSDGIGDTPYIIDETNQDNYPLMEPYSPLPRTLDGLESEIEELESEGEIDNQGTATSLLAKLNAAQTLIAHGKIDQAKTILNAFISEVQAQSGKHIAPEAAEILIESAEYIMSNL